jgi:hypothetical protein
VPAETVGPFLILWRILTCAMSVVPVCVGGISEDGLGGRKGGGGNKQGITKIKTSRRRV